MFYSFSLRLKKELIPFDNKLHTQEDNTITHSFTTVIRSKFEKYVSKFGYNAAFKNIKNTLLEMRKMYINI